MPRFKRISVMIMVAVCLVVMRCPSGHTADHKASRAELRGIEKIYIMIDCMTSEMETDVLTEEQLRADIRKALWVTELQVLPGKRYRSGKLFPTIGILHVACKAFKMQEGGYGYDVVIEVFRRIELKGKPPEISTGSAPVWSIKKIDIADEVIDIRNEIKNLTDAFARAYLSVNPTRPGSINRRGSSMKTF